MKTWLKFIIKCYKKNYKIPFQKKGQLNALDPFLFTAKKGLFLYQDQEIFNLFPNRTFGLTKYDGKFYFCTSPLQYNNPSFLFSYLNDTKTVSFKRIFNCADVHQIDYYANQLFITDTRNNRLLRIKGNSRDYIYPNGPLKNGVDSNNYSHFNSVFIDNNNLYIMAHNYTTKTGKMSSIYKLDRNTNDIISIFNTPAKDAHDLIVSNKNYIYCDSGNGRLMSNEKTILDLHGFFVRGLAYNQEFILLGLSQVASRAERNISKSFINIYNYDFELLSQLIFPTGVNQIYDICFIENEMSLSQSSTNNNPFPVP